MTSLDSFRCCKPLKVGSKTYAFYSLLAAEKNGLKGISRLPFTLKVLLENLLRHEDGRSIAKEDIQAVAQWLKTKTSEREIAFRPARVLMQDFTVVPPGTGICHQVNLEYLSQTVFTKKDKVKIDGKSVVTEVAYPDTVLGMDSHTTMVNGLAVLGWGVGGIEAEAAMLGQPYSMLLPEVIGVKLMGKLKEGVTATDLVLTVTQMLRQRGVVGKFVEFFGPGLANLTIADRATIG